MKSSPPELATIDPATRKIRFEPHPGQWEAWNATERFIAVIAGTQSGKTSFGPHWLYREIQLRGPGDYIVAAPSLQLLKKKALPEFLKVFRRWLKLGDYNRTDKIFTFSEQGAKRTFGTYDPEKPTVIFFGHAGDPDSLESATAKAVWCDEVGQKGFKLESWQALLRRLSLSEGRALLTTTPYNLGWLKQQIYDRWKRIGTEQEQPDDKHYRVVRFDSTLNPQFNSAEFDRAKRDLPPWKFDLFYRGIFTRPAGTIYDCFVDEYDAHRHPHSGPVYAHKCKPFAIPPDWPRLLCADFGNVNTALALIVENPATRPKSGKLFSGRCYLVKDYKAGNRTAEQHIDHFLPNDPKPRFAVGGAKSENNWREEYVKIGIPMKEPPASDVEVGINRVYGMIQNGDLIIFDTCEGTLAQIGEYSRELDPGTNEPTEEIEDKASYHHLDALRYGAVYMRSTEVTGTAYNPADAFVGINYPDRRTVPGPNRVKSLI